MTNFSGNVVMNFYACSRFGKDANLPVLLILYKIFIKGFIENNSNFTDIIDD
jgi:hypothetical protein